MPPAITAVTPGLLLGFRINFLKNAKTCSQFASRNIGQQIVAELSGSGIDRRNDAVSTRAKMNRLAATIVFCAFAHDPMVSFEAVKKGYQCRFLNPQARGDLRLGDGLVCLR